MAHVIDSFADSDTRVLAASVAHLPHDGAYRPCGNELLALVATIQRQAGPMPIVLGSGFEAQPELVARLAAANELAACSANTMRLLLDPTACAERLHRCGVRWPETRCARPALMHRWLAKEAGACGGGHVTHLDRSVSAAPARYFQRFVRGHSLSVVFLADGADAVVCSLSAHLRWSRVPTYRYEGAVAHWTDVRLRAQVGDMVRRVSRAFDLKGCCGIDFIHDSNGDLWVNDINPRPPATLDLIADRGSILRAHLTACQGQVLLYSRSAQTQASAHLVVYAGAPWTVPHGLVWPRWVADRPCTATALNVDDPVCSIGAQAPTPSQALELLERRYDALQGIVGDVLPKAREITCVGEVDDVETQA